MHSIRASIIGIAFVSVTFAAAAISCSSKVGTTGAGGAGGDGGDGWSVGNGPSTTGPGSGSSSSSGSGSGGSAGTSTGVGGASSGSGAGGGGPADDGQWLGLPCTLGADCGGVPGAQCASASQDDPVLGGGAAEGYCTKACQKSADCPGTSSLCLKPQGASEGRCMLGCEIGPPLNSLFDPLDDAKCHGRENVRCQRTAAGDMCVPTCGSDAECGPGRACELGSGVCVSMAGVGKPLGAQCDPNAAQEECESGLCVGGLSNGMGFCSGFCTLGGSTAYDECGGQDKGLCLISPAVQNCPAGQLCSGPGDYGFCTGNCDSHDDCPNPDLWCRTVLGAGRCFFAVGCTANGQTDCKNVSGTICTDVGNGQKFCLESKYPLVGP